MEWLTEVSPGNAPGSLVLSSANATPLRGSGYPARRSRLGRVRHALSWPWRA